MFFAFLRFTEVQSKHLTAGMKRVHLISIDIVFFVVFYFVFFCTLEMTRLAEAKLERICSVDWSLALVPLKHLNMPFTSCLVSTSHLQLVDGSSPLCLMAEFFTPVT